ncbi:hypothetical protein BDF20DRAFT_693350 [Mycotypha africana]|uniref:uncharacterized protein n=1 Tax=Mycotypha africana TaxID=64632 RepID=UPI0023000646|nr:uncharacterized protein BDF20DRAFT_693350 [Mycotypha africana]KAI8971685.1 hypothetical protein BDF20DRAFT_693350 [Mycotypha africana]
MLKNLYLLLLTAAFLQVIFAATLNRRKNDDDSSSSASNAQLDEESEEVKVEGALLVGASGVLVPDASADHPIIVSTLHEQPLCKPNQTIQPSRSLKVMEGYEMMVLTNKIKDPKKMVIDPTNHILVISPEEGLISIRTDKCGNADIKNILQKDKLEEPFGHGFAVYNGNLFVATTNSIYKFPYSDGQHSELQEGIKIMTNINPDDPSAQPDIAIDPFGYAFVPRAVSDLHDKSDASHAVIKKFNIKMIPENGFDFETDGEIQAVGTNTFGLMGFDTQARLWGLNGIPQSTIQRADIAGNHNLATSGLAEELNLYEFPQSNYGFPYCMTEYNLEGVSAASKGLGAQWAHPMFMNESVEMDTFCQQSVNNIGPSVPLSSNSIATSVLFYMGEFCSVGDEETHGTSVGLPCAWTDSPILANHGLPGQSAGHSVVHYVFDDLGHKPRWDLDPDVILKEEKPCTESTCFSPYGLAVDKYGRLLISSDETNEIFVISRIYNEKAVELLTKKAEAEIAGTDDDSGVSSQSEGGEDSSEEE